MKNLLTCKLYTENIPKTFPHSPFEHTLPRRHTHERQIDYDKMHISATTGAEMAAIIRNIRLATQHKLNATLCKPFKYKKASNRRLTSKTGLNHFEVPSGFEPL